MADTAFGQSAGWTQLTNTQLQNACPSNTPQYAFATNCYQVIASWSGGVADTLRNRLIVWGGGHNNYFGNEVYALDLNSNPPQLNHLNSPGPIADPNANPAQSRLSDNTPNSRETYGGLAYIANVDRMYVYGGFVAGVNTYAANDTWTFHFTDLSWQEMKPNNGGQGQHHNFGAVADYDPNTQLVFLHDASEFWKYDYASNTYTSLDVSSTNQYSSGVIDPDRKLFLIIGAHTLKAINIASGSNYSLQDWTAQASGCSGIVDSDYPGLAYDTALHLVVGWAGGNTVYEFNPDTKVCTAVTFSNGPGAQQPNGTNGRFRYFPALDIFALVNDAHQNAFTLRLTAGSPIPVISAVNAGSITTTGATITWTTDVPATSQVDYGTTMSYGSSTTLDSTLVTSHSVSLTGLSSGTTYHYRVRSKNASNVEAVSGDFAFTTTSSTAPTVSGTSPNTGAQGQSLSSVITGTNFQSGATCSFGAGITVNSCTFNSATQLTASLTIAANAGTGGRTVSVTNPDTQSGSLASGFTVNGAMHLDFNYTDRNALLNAGWSYIATTAGGGSRNTEQTGTLAVSYDQVAHPGTIRIPLGSGEIWSSSNNSQNMLILSVPTNWTSIRVKIAAFNPVARDQEVGLLAYVNDDNYVMLNRIFGSNGSVVETFGESAQSTFSMTKVAITNTGNLILRLDRSSNTYTGLYSTNGGSTWSTIATVNNALTNPKLAIQVGGDTSGTTPNADLAWVEYQTQ